MSDENGAAAGPQGDALSPAEENYTAPAQKSVADILQTDVEDEALRRYKETLLGKDAIGVVIDENNPKNVLVRSLTLVVDGRDDITMDLSEATALSERSFTVQEGCSYRLRINFHVQREIVAGLKYVHKVHRKGIQVEKEEYMVGSYGPKRELQSFTTPIEEAPSGMLYRGSYKIKSFFTDDDKHDWLSWEWKLEIKKDWE